MVKNNKTTIFPTKEELEMAQQISIDKETNELRNCMLQKPFANKWERKYVHNSETYYKLKLISRVLEMEGYAVVLREDEFGAEYTLTIYKSQADLEAEKKKHKYMYWYTAICGLIIGVCVILTIHLSEKLN